MTLEPGTRSRPTHSRLVIAAGSYALLGGVLTLVGWFTDQRRLTDWYDSGISQMPNNATGVALAAIALLLHGRSRRAVVMTLAALVALIGTATLFQHLTSIDLGIDQLLVQLEWGHRGAIAPGRMGLPGSVSLSVIGLSLIALQFSRTRALAALGGTIVIAIAMLSMIGYLFGADPLYTLPRLTTIALQTSTMLIALGAGVLACVSENVGIRMLVSPSAAGVFLRRLLPAVVALPVVLGLVQLHGQRSDWYDAGFGTAALVLALIATLVGVVFWAAIAVRDQELAAGRSHEQLASVLGSITDAFMSLDREWKFTFLNAAARERLAARGVDALGRSLWEALPETVDSEAYRQLQRAMAERVPIAYELHLAHWGRWFAERAYPTPEGGLAVYSADITERKLLEESLRDAESRNQLAIAIARVGTWDLDVQTGVNRWSDSHFMLMGRAPTRDRIAPESWWRDAIVAEDRSAVLAEMERARASRDRFESRHRMRRADNGELMHIRAAGQFLYDADGRALRFIGALLDETQRVKDQLALEELTDELLAADRRKDEFLATLAHELRNPLAPLRSAADLLTHARGKPEILERVQDVMRRQVTHMVRMVDDLLDVSRITRDKLELRFDHADLVAVVRHAMETCDPQIRAAGHQIHVSLPAQPLAVRMDAVRMTQVLSNLLSNATKFTPAGGNLWLSVETEAEEAVVTVRDNGMGIPQDKLGRVFEMFAQLDHSLERSERGLGIGLTLAQRIVRLHRGTLTASSEGPGCGSTFKVRLPLRDETTSPAGEPSASQVEGA